MKVIKCETVCNKTKIEYNGSVLAEVGDFRAETVKSPQKHHRSRSVDDTTNAPILANTCYRLPFQRIINFKTNIK